MSDHPQPPTPPGVSAPSVSSRPPGAAPLPGSATSGFGSRPLPGQVPAQTPPRTANAVAGPSANSPTQTPISLDEFCTAVSRNDRRVEMIGAFHHSERGAGKLADTEANYQTRYEAFCKAPA